MLRPRRTSYDAREYADRMAERGSLIMGGPEDCIRALQAKLDEVGPVGGLLVADHDWAPWVGRLESYHLLHEEVLPHLACPW